MLRNIIPSRINKNSILNYRGGSILNNLLNNIINDNEDDFISYPIWSKRTNSVLTSGVNLSENTESIQVSVNLPGFNEKDIKVDLDGNKLIIEAKSDEKKNRDEKKYYFSERIYGTLQRVIAIDVHVVDVDKIKASLRNGVLTINLPKLQNIIKRKKIDISYAK